VGGRDALARYRHSRHLTAVIARGKQRSVRIAGGTGVYSTEPSTSSPHGVDATTGQVASVLSVQSTFDEEVEGRLSERFIGPATAARYDDAVMTDVRCRRRCRQQRHCFQHVNASMLHHVWRTSARRRVVSRCLTVRRRCSVVVDRRQATDVTSGHDVTMVSATDSESCLDRAFLANDQSDDLRSVTKWQPDLSPISVASVALRRQCAGERTRVADGRRNNDIVAQSATAHCIDSPGRLPTTICDMVGSVVTSYYMHVDVTVTFMSEVKSE